MTPPEDMVDADALPQARVRRSRWRFSVVWVVPLIAAIVAGYLVYSRVREVGPTITITFKDGFGVKPGQTDIRYRGVRLGEVMALELSPDQESVVVKARLRGSGDEIAREGSAFWIVRPEVGLGTVSGLSTVITGPYIQVLPGKGKPTKAFKGLESPPAALERQGLKVVAATSYLGSATIGSPVYYRGIQVGSVTGSELGPDATRVHIHLFISRRYARLVRIGSRFWSVSGVDVNVSLLKGVEINVESLRSLAAGGIAFATPDNPDGLAKDGTIFVLHEKPQKEWLLWTPTIPLPPAE
jgi:paraquat-inducible protein B